MQFELATFTSPATSKMINWSENARHLKLDRHSSHRRPEYQPRWANAYMHLPAASAHSLSPGKARLCRARAGRPVETCIHLVHYREDS